MNGLLSAEELEIQEQVRHFATSKLLPRIVKDNAAEKFDRDIMYEMGEMGLLGATIQGTSSCSRCRWRLSSLPVCYSSRSRFHLWNACDVLISDRLWMHRRQLCIIWPYRERGRESRQRVPIGHERAIVSCHVSHLYLRYRGTKAEVVAQARHRRENWLFWFDRA